MLLQMTLFHPFLWVRNISLCVCARVCMCVHILCNPAPRQAPLSMGFPRQEYWSGLPFPSPGNLLNWGESPESPILTGRFLTTEPEAYICICMCVCILHLPNQLNTDWVVSMSWLLQNVLIWLGCMDLYKLELSFFLHIYYIPGVGLWIIW